jgi:hypothetical protein
MLTHPTLDQLRALKLDGMAQALSRPRWRPLRAAIPHAGQGRSACIGRLGTRSPLSRSAARSDGNRRGSPRPRFHPHHQPTARGNLAWSYRRAHSRGCDIGPHCPQRLPARTRRSVATQPATPTAADGKTVEGSQEMTRRSVIPAAPVGQQGPARAAASAVGTPQRARVPPVTARLTPSVNPEMHQPYPTGGHHTGRNRS